MIPACWLDWAPPGICHTGLEVLPVLGAAASIGGTVLSAVSAANQADYAEKVAEAESRALQERANEATAAAQREAITEARKTELLQSRVRAVAASGGGLATDPTVVDIEGDIAQQGAYNAMSALHAGLSRARADRQQAQIELFRGRRAGRAGPITAGATVLSGLSNFATNWSRLRS